MRFSHPGFGRSVQLLRSLPGSIFRGPRRVAIAVGASVLLIGGMLVGTALADSTPTPVPSPTNGKAAQSAKYHDIFLGKLASLLGVEQSKIAPAMSEASKQTVDEAVKAGDLTQVQADKLKLRIDQNAQSGRGFGSFGGFGFGIGHRGPGGMMGSAFGQAALDAAAKKLSLTTAELQTSLRSGKSLSDIAKDKGVSDQDLRAAIVDGVQPSLVQAVKDGKLTQKQADALVQRIQQGQWPGFERGRGGMMRPNGTNPSAPKA
jgi:polyhydroxyalkanoate synthesis regulator phasin